MSHITRTARNVPPHMRRDPEHYRAGRLAWRVLTVGSRQPHTNALALAVRFFQGISHLRVLPPRWYDGSRVELLHRVLQGCCDLCPLFFARLIGRDGAPPLNN